MLAMENLGRLEIGYQSTHSYSACRVTWLVLCLVLQTFVLHESMCAVEPYKFIRI